MNKEKFKIKTINVYLTHSDKKFLSEIREKYHISFSTIAKVLLRILMLNNDDKFSVLIWADHYFYQDKNQYKTSIKPRLWENEKDYWNEVKTINGWTSGGITMILTNMLKAFTRSEIGKLTGWPENIVNKRKSQIYNQFGQEYDPNWNGNAFAHQFVRFARKNPEYTRKIIGGQNGED